MSTNAVPTQLSHDRPLWQPDAGRIAASNLEQFRIRAEQRTGLSLPDYAALHRWSVEDRAGFWQLVWDFCEVVGERGNTALVDKGHMREARFFRRRGSISRKTCCAMRAKEKPSSFAVRTRSNGA